MSGLILWSLCKEPRYLMAHSSKYQSCFIFWKSRDRLRCIRFTLNSIVIGRDLSSNNSMDVLYNLSVRRIFHFAVKTWDTDSVVGRTVAQMRYSVTRQEVLGSIFGRVLGNFQVTQYFCPQAVVLGSTQPLTERSTKEFRRGLNATGA